MAHKPSATIVAREPLDPDEAHWTKLVKVTYRDAVGTQRIWESAERTTRPASSAVDGVDIMAVLVDSQDPSWRPHIILLKQFRPAVGKTVIEVPAGLVDAGESPEQSAIRELREETGYTGTLSSPSASGVTPASSSPLVLFSDPGFSNNNLNIIHLIVDRSRPENQNPQPALEDGELVEDVFTVPLADLPTRLRQLDAEGYAIDARLGTLTAAMELVRQFLPGQA